LTRREKWEIKAAKRGARKQRPRIKYPENTLGKMLKYWDDSPHTKGKKKQRVVNVNEGVSLGVLTPKHEGLLI
jgi:hypothetical protein